MTHVLTRTHLIAPKDLIEEVDRIVGPRRRSEFIAAAVAEKLKREKLLHALRRAAKLPAESDIPGWETTEAAQSGSMTCVPSQTAYAMYEVLTRYRYFN